MNNYFLDVAAENRDALKEVYTQLHISIKDNPGNIAVHFPHYHYDSALRKGSVGLTLRVFASTADQLNKLQLQEKAQMLKIPAVFAPINKVPDEVLGYCSVSRVSFKSKSKIRREARRAVQSSRFNNYDEAFIALSLVSDTFAPLPAVFVHSLSTNKDFPIHIEVTPVGSSINGIFNPYGLSKDATVPVF